MPRISLIQRCLVVATLVAGALSATVARAEQKAVMIHDAKDASIRLNSPHFNSGQAEMLQVGQNAMGQTYQMLIAFDLSQIPEGAAIESAHLLLRPSSTKAEDTFKLAAHRVLKSWEEGNGDANGAVTSSDGPTGVTCMYRDRAHRTSRWEKEGLAGAGDVAPEPTAVIDLFDSDARVPMPKVGTFIRFDVTADVRSFAAGEAKNFGWLIRSDDPAIVPILSTQRAQGYEPRMQVIYTMGNSEKR